MKNNRSNPLGFDRCIQCSWVQPAWPLPALSSRDFLHCFSPSQSFKFALWTRFRHLDFFKSKLEGAVEVAEHHVPCSLLTAAAVHRNWSLSATQQHVKSVLLRTWHFLCQEVLFSPPSMTARQGGIWDEMGVWASLSGLKELHQTLIVQTEVTEGGQLSCLCVPTELINKDCSWRVLNWTRLLLFYRASGTHSFVFLSQAIPAEAENLTELLLPSWKVSRIKVLMEEIMVTEALELCM